jgi:hypothetical protein
VDSTLCPDIEPPRRRIGEFVATHVMGIGLVPSTLKKEVILNTTRTGTEN